MSFGIVCFRIVPDTKQIQYLMIRRKDSLGYVDFLRGKFNQYNDFHLRNIIHEMTKKEIHDILHHDYPFLWNQLWNKSDEKYDKKNMEKFNYVKTMKLELLQEHIPHAWDEPEWGFPKGRRNIKENDYDCSIREFEEETGYNKQDILFIKNLGFFEETFTGSNLKSYRHKYYLCRGSYEKTRQEDKFQKSEIGDLKWFSFQDCLSKIRIYNYEKKAMLSKINNIVTGCFCTTVWVRGKRVARLASRRNSESTTNTTYKREKYTLWPRPMCKRISNYSCSTPMNSYKKTGYGK